MSGALPANVGPERGRALRQIGDLALRQARIYTGASPERRCGRVAEGGALLKRYTLKGVSRVRIPSSPPFPIELIFDRKRDF